MDDLSLETEDAAALDCRLEKITIPCRSWSIQAVQVGLDVEPRLLRWYQRTLTRACETPC